MGSNYDRKKGFQNQTDTGSAPVSVDTTQQDLDSQEPQTVMSPVSTEVNSEAATQTNTGDQQEPSNVQLEDSGDKTTVPDKESDIEESTDSEDMVKPEDTEKESDTKEPESSETLDSQVAQANSVDEFKAKLQDMAINGHILVRALASKLHSYAEAMGPKSTMLSEQVASGKNYDLFVMLRKVTEIENYSEFKTCFDIINMTFKQLSKEAYSANMLLRHDMHWEKTWGKQSLTTYQNLVTVVASLCDLETRERNKKTLDIKLALDKSKTVFNETAINNITKYYL